MSASAQQLTPAEQTDLLAQGTAELETRQELERRIIRMPVSEKALALRETC